MDDLEKEFETKLEDMTPGQLLTYFEKRKSRVLDIQVAVGGRTELNHFKSFKERYGESAGRVLKYAIEEWKCEYPKGNILTASSFGSRSSWITEAAFSKLQLEEKEASRVEERTEELRQGFASLKDL